MRARAWLAKTYKIKNMHGIKLRSFILALACLVSWDGVARDEVSKQVAEVDFAAFIRLVEDHHPEKALDQVGLEVTKSAEGRAGVLPDPQLTITDEGTWKATLTQTFPWPGTNAAIQAGAAASTEVAATKNHISRLERRFAAEEFFVNLVYIAALVENEKNNLREARMTVAREGARLGQTIANHYDFIRAQNEITIYATNLDSLEVDLKNAEDRGAQWIGATGTIVFQRTLPNFFLSQDSNTEPDDGTDLRKSNLEAKRSLAQAQFESARKNLLPNFMAGVMGMKDDDGMQSFSIMAGIQIPIFSHSVRAALTTEKSLAAQQASEEIAWHQAQKQLAVRQNHRIVQRLRKNVEAIRSVIIPRLEDHLKTVSVEYTNGTGTLTQVTTARRDLFSYQRARAAAERDLGLAIVAAERIRAGLITGALDAVVPKLASDMNPQMADLEARMGAQPGNPTDESESPAEERKNGMGM